MTSKKPAGRTHPTPAGSADAFRLLFQSHPTPMWIYDLRTLAFLEVNDAAVHRYGYSRDEFLAMTLTDIRPPEDLPRLLESVARWPEGLEVPGEWRHQFKDGRVIDVAITSHTLPFKGSKAKLVSAVDVTDRKRTDEALRASEERYHRFFDLDLTGDYLSTPDGTLLACNPAFAAMLGFASVEEALSAETVSLYARPEDRRAFLDLLARERVLRNHECPLVRHDGTPIQVVENVVGIFDAEGRLQQLQGFLFDITERKRAEDALRQQKQVLSESQRIAHLGSWVVDLETLRIQWSDEMYRIFGVSKRDFEHTPEAFLLLIHPDDRAAMQDWIRACAAGEGPGDLEFRVVRSDGGLRWVLGRGDVEYDAARRPIRELGTAQDITERKQLQDQLLQAQKIESVGRLAGGVAHDFNNLLTVINSSAELALAELKAGDPLREDLEEIRAAGARAAELTRQLLAFSRKQLLQPVVLNLNALVAATEKMLRRLIGEDIDLKLVPGEDLGSVKADPGQIEQVIVNLAVNARDAMPTGGKLTIETKDVELDEAYASRHAGAHPGSYVMLAMSDTGTGMDEATRARIFEPFFTTKEAGRGTGLGLSTVYGIVKQSGGYIWVHSEIGGGTTFKVYLPRVAEAARDDHAVPAQASARGTETVLVVEDEKALRRAASRILSSAGYTVLEAADGAEALRMMEGHAGPLHLLLTDVIMPGLSGREVAERLGALRPGLKVLFSSGYADDAILRHGVLDQSVHFIAKPYTAAALTRKVREVLDS